MSDIAPVQRHAARVSDIYLAQHWQLDHATALAHAWGSRADVLSIAVLGVL